MAASTPNSRRELIEYCLRRLGSPVQEIEVDPQQIEDLLDDALQYFKEYNALGAEKTYLKHQITQEEIDRQNAIPTLTASTISFHNNATTSNSSVPDTITDSASQFLEKKFVPGMTITITGSSSNNGTYRIATVTASTITLITGESLTNESAGSSVTITAQDIDAANYIELHPSVLNVLGIFTLTNDNLTSGEFSVQYQFMLNNVHDIAYGGLIHYDTTRSYLRTLQMLFTGEKSFRYKRNGNRLYLDMNWKVMFEAGDYIMIECYRAIDPDAFPTIYNDPTLKKYLTALIKRQWGTNLKKFNGIALPGGVVMESQRIFDEAEQEIARIEQEIESKYQEPPMFFLG